MIFSRQKKSSIHYGVFNDDIYNLISIKDNKTFLTLIQKAYFGNYKSDVRQ